ncbi:transposase [Streptomyces lavendulae]|uniref:transposase n=1 Tax=Streptomyces lavendulae TaxID=1914 RepID=UPI0033EF7A95
MIPRTFPPAPGWSADGRRIKSELDYGRRPEKTWVYGGLRVRDGQQVTMTATSRNSAFYQQFLQKLEMSNPVGAIYVITDNLSSHNSLSTRTWLEDHPRIKHVFIPVGACWLNLQEAWWRIFRKAALAGQTFAGPDGTRATRTPRPDPARCPTPPSTVGWTSADSTDLCRYAISQTLNRPVQIHATSHADTVWGGVAMLHSAAVGSGRIAVASKDARIPLETA